MVETLTTPEIAQWLLPLSSLNERDRQRALHICAAVLEALGECSLHENLEVLAVVDQPLIDIDHALARTLAAIDANPRFKQLRSDWLGVHYLLEATHNDQMIEINLLSVSKEDLLEDFSSFIDITGSGLFHYVYKREYDQAGGSPFTSILMSFSFDKSEKDLTLLGYLAQVSASCHAPAIGNIDLALLGVRNPEDLETLDLNALFSQSDYLRWNAFRAREDARYIGLIMPQIRAAFPSDPLNPRFIQLPSLNRAAWAWIPAVYGFGILLINGFRRYGWCAQLTGASGGGKLELRQTLMRDDGSKHFDQQRLELGDRAFHFVDSPLEVNLSDQEEQHIASHGLMSFIYPRYLEAACLYNAPSIQRRDLADDNPAANLPYLYLISRFAHYQKVMQRENIGVSTDPDDLENMLNTWLSRFISSMPGASPEARAERPLKEGRVKVTMDPESPGHFQVNLTLKPHLQMEGIDTRLSLSSKMRR